MDLKKKLEDIKEHFETISEEEFEAKLKEAGIDEIESCSKSNVTML